MAAHRPSFCKTSDSVLAGAVFAGGVLEVLFPTAMRGVDGLVLVIVGGCMLLLAWTMLALSKLSFLLHAQRSKPGVETTRLITSGIFRYSRNPMYLAVLLIIVAIGLIFNSLWVLGAAAAGAVVMHYMLIIPEERYLEERFGEQYQAYKTRVRRWL